MDTLVKAVHDWKLENVHVSEDQLHVFYIHTTIVEKIVIFKDDLVTYYAEYGDMVLSSELMVFYFIRKTWRFQSKID
jgi:energy-converting hydrogenase Eha subunit F